MAAEAEQDEEIMVDVVNTEKPAAFCSSDEENDDHALQFLPMAPEIDDPEDGWGKFYVQNSFQNYDNYHSRKCWR